MQTPNPRIVVLGGPIPEILRAQLAGNIDLLPEVEIETGDWTGILVYARNEALSAVRRFRNAGGVAAIYGLSETPVDVAQRIRWIREGADDLLAMDTAAGVLARRLRGPATRVPGALASVPTGVRLDRYLTALSRYLSARSDVLGLLGEAGRQRFLDCHFLRDQVLKAADGDFPDTGNGQRRGSDREPLQWGVHLANRATDDAIAELQNIGADGLGLALRSPMTPGELMRVDLDGYTMSAVISVEVRWQRRSSKDRWEVGCFVLSLDITRKPPV